MAQDTATMDAIHKANSVKIQVQVQANYNAAALIAPNYGHKEPSVNPDFMQGTSAGVQPTRFMLTRVG